MVQIDWDGIKDFSTRYSAAIQYTEDSYRYVIFVSKDGAVFWCGIVKMTPRNPEQIDFEDNYK